MTTKRERERGGTVVDAPGCGAESAERRRRGEQLLLNEARRGLLRASERGENE